MHTSFSRHALALTLTPPKATYRFSCSRSAVVTLFQQRERENPSGTTVSTLAIWSWETWSVTATKYSRRRDMRTTIRDLE